MHRPLAVAVLLVLAGCLVGAPTAPVQGPGEANPATDTIGWENGYWYDDPLSVTPEDGLNDTEREAVVSRTMARVEHLRQLEFEERVPVSVETRAEFRDGQGPRNTTAAERRWNDQVWEALFIVGEDESVADAFNATLGTSVQGYYSVDDDEIVVVSDADAPGIDRSTLAHELLHALQDQHFGLDDGRETQDGQLASDGIVEGDAMALQSAYLERCGDEWECLPPVEGAGGDTPAGYNRGVFLTIYQPYATGDDLVAEVRDRGGLPAVNDVYADPPVSSEQVIHPERYPDETPENVSVPDRSSDEWERFDVDPVADTVGEASIYAMLLTNDVVDPTSGTYGYRSEASEGWAGDALVPYRTEDERYGYVWKTTWDSRGDAEEFVAAYRDLLTEAHDAERRGAGVYVVDEARQFGDAFRVTRRGDTVQIVNAPTVEELDSIHG